MRGVLGPTANGDLLLQSPTKARSGARNLLLGRHSGTWADDDGRGLAKALSTGFVLLRRSPNISQTLKSRL